MAVGDDAVGAGFSLVPSTGEEGKKKYGPREINRTRDYIAIVKKLIPVGAGGFRAASGIGSGLNDPSNDQGKNGDIYFKVL